MAGAGGGALAGAAWPEVRAAPLVLVPVGSTEQHGPHLPLSTDTVIAQAVAERAAGALRTETAGQVFVAPAIPFGASGEHAGFPGTVSIGHEALHAVIVETVRSLALWAGRAVLVNGHGGNVPALGAAVGRLRREGHDVAWAGCDPPGGDAHAGLTETSAMLYLAPDLVRPFGAVTGETRPLAAIMPELVARGVRAVSPSGVLGDPAGASAERGREIVESMAASVALRIGGGRADGRGRLLDPGVPSRGSRP
ncbi:mycofactocin biosynthesis peptidyl-dipeptidase MftE [Actinomadura sp. KC345]|uniref:mycofactocin biosynthesis peptidyl-dipeptidase MftE n=1 Tax=Actinomadura sp. KC345 TaxID=2530371 RepID=UPI0010530D67|nr:mycofactocin biosynthesis peptidyl-dipeptidase MftE [Actinomadura sp. KC345]TDC54040.1 mycofactocin biosynthesis peptidyl-dipeptidase MftE [Actinomadura sp. KC345]